MPGVLMQLPGVLVRMPRDLTHAEAGDHAWGAGAHASAVGWCMVTAYASGTGADASAQGMGNVAAACPAQPGVPADRFAREIMGFLTQLLGRARGS